MLLKLESEVLVEAPPAVVFRFYRDLDHLRFVCTERRREWCPEPGVMLAPGHEGEVRLRQGRHEITLRFKTVHYEQDMVLEDAFLSWPLKGARRQLVFHPRADGQHTRIHEVNVWRPPFFARAAVKERQDDQQSLFDQKLLNAKAVIERVHADRGDDAFSGGVWAEAAAAGIEPVVPGT